METLTKPQVISGAFAYEGEKNTIPDAPTGSYLASVQEGFPPITMKPKSQGGLPPEGRDFNGVFNLMSQFYFYKQNGGMYTFDEDVSNAIGGYPLNAMLWYFPASGTAKWLRSNKANNTDNFITNPEVIGTSWIEENTAASLGNVGDIKESTRLGDAPMGGVWADGSEYTFAEYPQVGEMLQEGLLRQKTYADWQTELTTYGETEYFAYDSGTQKFKVPNMPYSGLDGSVDDTTLDVYSRPSRKYVVLYTGYQEISLKDYTDEIEAVVNEGISDINSASTTATNSFNSNATTKTNAFNTNASDKTDDFNSNYTTQLNAFNNNATSKTTAFNGNATSQTNAFNTNAEQKQAAVDSAAAEAEASANNAADSENSAQIWAEGTDEQVQELGGTHSAKGWAAQFDIGPATETSAGTTRYATVAEANAATINNAAVTPAGLADLYADVNSKQATITGGASSITTNNLTASRALVSDGSGKVAVSAVTSTELGYLDGANSNIQTQLNARAKTDLTNVSPAQSFKDMSIGWGLPDYSAGVSVDFPITGSGAVKSFTASFSGRLVVSQSSANNWCYIFKNQDRTGLIDSFRQTGSVGGFDSVVVDLEEGETIYYEMPKSAREATLYPFKGVNNA